MRCLVTVTLVTETGDNTMTTERDIERRFTNLGKRRGIPTPKFSSPGNSGVPDRIVLFPDGTVEFVELKAPGKKPRPLQEIVFRQFAAHGHEVKIIDSLEKAEAYWRDR